MKKKEILRGLGEGRVENRGQLDQDTFKVKGDQSMRDVTEPRMRINTGTDKIDTKQIGKITSGEDFAKRAKDLGTRADIRATRKAAEKAGDQDMINRLKLLASKMGRVGSKSLKALPIVGGIASAMGSGDASAAVPVLGDAEALGPAKGSLEEALESGEATDDQKREMARRMAIQNKLMGGK